MTIESTNEGSCEPHLLPKGNPTDKRSLDALGAYAQQTHGAITEAERPLTAQYWLLGLALSLAREKFKHGKWVQHLKTLGIDKTRASKASAIFKANPSEEEAAALSVAEAYAKRRRKKTLRSEPPVLGEKAEFRQFLRSTSLEAEKYIHVAAFLEPVEATEFAFDVENAIKAFGEILLQLRQSTTAKAAS